MLRSLRTSRRWLVVPLIAAGFGVACAADRVVSDGSNSGITVAAVRVSPPNVTVDAGRTVRLAATALDAANHVITGRAVAWTSTDTSIARVADGLVTAVRSGTTSVTASIEGISATSTVLVQPPAVATVQLSLNAGSIAVMQETQATTVLRDAAGLVLTGRAVAWSTSNAAVASVDAAGRVRGVGAGTATITATSEGRTGSAAITVTPQVVTSVVLAPGALSLSVGQAGNIAATLRDGFGNAVAGRQPAWSSSAPGIVTVSASGAVSAVAAGSATITATIDGVSGSAIVTVAASGQPVAQVTPSSLALTLGGTGTLTAVMRDASGNPVPATFAWSTSNAAAATVDGAGRVTAVGVGTANIIASADGRSASAQVTVSPVPVASVTITPASLALVAGQSGALIATCRDAAGNALGGRTITWASSAAGVATVDVIGGVRAVSAGTATITATCEGRSAAVTVTVTPVAVASVTISPATATVTVGATIQLTATARDAGGNVLAGRTATWSSSNNATAAVSTTGLVTGGEAGSAVVTAVIDGASATRTVTVNAPPPPPPPGTGEPVYSATQHALLLRDDFNGYASRTAMLAAYPTGRRTEFVDLITGRGNTGGAARLKYGTGGGTYDIVFGPAYQLDAVGGWNGTLPEKAGPFTHFYFTTWFRFSAGADPTTVNNWGVKGFMFWHMGAGVQGGRYQNAINASQQGDSYARGPKGANPSNAISGHPLYKTPDGKAPLFSTLADGQWHRFTIELYAGNDPSGRRGERFWVDGTLIYDDVGVAGIGMGTAVDHYDYAYPVQHWMVFGNFITEAAMSPYFTFDVDDWSAWTTR